MEEVVCVRCGAIITNEEDIIDTVDGKVCSECALDYVRCDHCGQLVHKDDTVKVHADGRGIHIISVCPSCADEHFTLCDDCDEYYPADTMTEVANGNLICLSCRDDNYTTCGACGEWFRTEDMVYVRHNDTYYCGSCAEDNSGHDSRIRSYHDNPEVEFYGDFYRGRQHHIGWELEIDRSCFSRCDESNLIDALENIAGDRLYYMEDGSLNNGFEIICQPHTMHAQIYDLHIEDILRECSYYGYSSHSAHTCGLHFHISRELFGPEKYRDTAIQKMMLFYDNNYKEIVKFARRDSEQLHWCQRYSSEDNEDLNVKERAYKYKEFDRNSFRHDDRYRVVNTINRDTVEIRIVRGTLKYETFMASLDFVNTIANNSRSISWSKSTDVRRWLNGLRPETIEYLRSRNAFVQYLQ